MFAMIVWAAVFMPFQDLASGAKAATDSFKPDPSWKSLGKAIWFDAKTRSLVVRARVALREGPLEHLLCLEQTKEHESVLATDAAPRLIHAGLILSAGEPGHPMRYQPKFEPPAGPPIAIELEWSENGASRRANAKEWVKDLKTGKALEIDWVFAGSELFVDEETKKQIYAADGGDLITVANFPSAIMDLPIASSADDANREFVAFTSKIPPRGTPVTMILRAARKTQVPDPSAKAAPKP
jgi:hypothetical protein